MWLHPCLWLEFIYFLAHSPLFANGQHSCFGGIESFEKTTGVGYGGQVVGTTILQQQDSALTRDCVNLCKQQSQCNSFTLNYVGYKCTSFQVTSQGRRELLVDNPSLNYFEKICFRGVQKNTFDALCGDRLWAFERVKESYLEGFIDREESNVKDKEECAKMCLLEDNFPCRSADFDEVQKLCKLSREDRRSQPQAFRQVPGSSRDYLENQCSATEQCTLGVFTYEKITGFVMRSAARTAIQLSSPGALGNTLECRQFCQSSGLDCPAFSVNYQNMRCDKLDRNSQGRTQELSPRAGENYFEKICLRGNFATACQGKAWAFERVLGMELVPTLYEKSFSHVLSRRDCEEHCLNEQAFNCRSAVYFDDTAECRLSRHDRRTQPDGVIKTSNPRINYLENQCIEETPTCPYEKTADAYPIYTDVVATTGIVSEQACESFCTTYPNFHCRSYAYYPSNGQCFISGDDRASAGPGSTNSRPGILFYERACKDNAAQTVSTGSPLSTDTGLNTIPPGVATRGPPPLPSPSPSVSTLYPPLVQSCLAGEKMTFARVSGYESAARPGAILLTSPSDGMTKDCLLKCQQREDCRSFTIDYKRHECFISGYYRATTPAHLRPAPAKSYFEGICVRANVPCGGRLWATERLVDQELAGTYPRDVTRYISMHDCERRCVEERTFICKAAVFDVNLQECKLFAEDRSHRAARLTYGRGMYYIENQCAILTAPCKYTAIERDVYMTHITRIVHGVTSTFHCELECNRESDFNCRSYTYVENGSLGPPQCLLSADNRQAVSPGILEYRSRSLYAEKDCRESSVTTLSSDNYNGRTTQDKHRGSLPGSHPSGSTPSPRQPSPANQVHTGFPSSDSPTFCSFDQYTYEKTIGYNLRFAPRDRIPTRATVGVVSDAYAECQRLGDRCRSFVVEYGDFQVASWLPLAAEDNRNALSVQTNAAYFEKVCFLERHCHKLWTFERMMNFEMRTTPERELSGIRRRAECEDYCLRERAFICKSATYQQSRQLCLLYSETRRSKANSVQRTNEDIDYLENMCAPESASTCVYQDTLGRFLPVIDRLTHAFTIQECQRLCDLERRFPCRSINYESVHHDCALSSEDLASYPLGNGGLIYRRFSIFSEKGSCEQVSVQCNQQDMVLTLNFDMPFHGRIYSRNNPNQCYVMGNGQTQMQYIISLGTRCGTTTEGPGKYVNEVMVQQHPVIMTDTDRNIRVVCSFEASDKTVTLASTLARNSIAGPFGGASGLDVTTGHRPTLSSIVANTAPPPTVGMRIVDHLGRDANAVGLGDELTLIIEIRDPESAFAIFARNLYARSSTGESLFLIDDRGCPVDAAVFPSLEPEFNNNKVLKSTFKAFRFPASGVVNFEVQIRFCQERCEPVRCHNSKESYGRRRKRSVTPITGEAKVNTTTTTIRVEESTTAKGESVAEYEGSSEEVTEEVIKQGRAVVPQDTTTDLYSASTTELPTTEQTFDITAEDSITNSKNSNIHIEDMGNTNVTSSIEDELKKPYGGYGLGGGKIYAKIFPEDIDVQVAAQSASARSSDGGTHRQPAITVESHVNMEPPPSRTRSLFLPVPEQGATFVQDNIPLHHLPPMRARYSAPSIPGWRMNPHGPHYHQELSRASRFYQVHWPAKQPPQQFYYRGIIRELPHIPEPPQLPKLFVAPRFPTGLDLVSTTYSNASENLIADSSETRSFEGKSISSEEGTTHAPEVLSIAKWNQGDALHEKKRSEDFVDGIRGNSVSQKESSLFQDTAKVEEFPLSMAIVVSDESKTPHDRNWDRETPTYRPPRARKKENSKVITNGPNHAAGAVLDEDALLEAEEVVCDTHTTVIVTAFIVSLVHIALACAGYLFWRWHRASFERSRALIHSLRSSGQPGLHGQQMFLGPTHPMNYQYLQHSSSSKDGPSREVHSLRSPVIYGTSEVSFRQVYGDFETPP
ncbi:uncharacterized protein LOC111272502 [Varroa jacobsoni]|uniref:uncharacterized protein LOC111272502 n=1 Tax=Varroa jacobsoni TaxID=62625 RepID=UPI000BF79530|nr:uncharacterized protein LOC111272502 [Varroa jacobsoni]